MAHVINFEWRFKKEWMNERNDSKSFRISWIKKLNRANCHRQQSAFVHTKCCQQRWRLPSYLLQKIMMRLLTASQRKRQDKKMEKEVTIYFFLCCVTARLTAAGPCWGSALYRHMQTLIGVLTLWSPRWSFNPAHSCWIIDVCRANAPNYPEVQFQTQRSLLLCSSSS